METRVAIANHAITTACVYSLLGKGCRLSVYSKEAMLAEMWKEHAPQHSPAPVCINSTDGALVVSHMLSMESCYLVAASKEGCIRLYFNYGLDGYDCIENYEGGFPDPLMDSFLQEMAPLCNYYGNLSIHWED